MLRRAMAMFFFLLPLFAIASKPVAPLAGLPQPDGYSDRLCETPQKLTGAVQVGPWSEAFSYHPSIVWDGSAFGMAWSSHVTVTNNEIYFARIAADGTILVAPTRITNSALYSALPSLVWTGSEYGVAWDDERTTINDIYFARISTAGTKIGSDVQITNDAGLSDFPSLAWTGTEYGVAWHDSRNANYDIYFARISAAGAKIGTDVQITTDAAASSFPKLVWSGTEYGVAWEDTRTTTRDIYFARISAAGAKVGADKQVTSDPQASKAPSLAWTGSIWSVAWQDSRGGTADDIYFARLDPTGNKIGSDVQLTSNAGTDTQPQLAWTGSEFGMTFLGVGSGSNEFSFLRVSASGVKQGSEFALASTGTIGVQYGVLAFGTKGYGVAYLDSSTLEFAGLGCHNDLTTPSCPASPAETARTSTTVTLGWAPSLDPQNDIAHYDIYRDGLWADVTTGTTWTDSAFDPAAGPMYIVSATNAAGLTSPACDSVNTSDSVPPTCPENLLASGVTQTSARLDWLPAMDAQSGLRRYKVYRNDISLTNVLAGTTTYTDATLTANTPYNFAVRAEDWAGNYSTTCATASVYIATSPIVLFVTKNADKTNADLDWNNVGLNEYVVYRSTSAQAASELKRVPVDQAQDAVLRDGVQLWYYYIQQRE